MKKVISVVLCVALLLSVVPITAVAENEHTLTAEENGLVTEFKYMSPFNVAGDFVLDGTALVGYTGNNPHVVIPDNLGITEIGFGAFGSCDSIVQSVVIPEGVLHINGDVGGSYRLKSITLPSTLKTIGINSFGGTGIISLTIPAGVEYIDVKGYGGIFSGIDACQVIFEAEAPPIINDSFICWRCENEDCLFDIITCSEWRCSMCGSKTCPGDAITCPNRYAWCWNCDSDDCPGVNSHILCPKWTHWLCGTACPGGVNVLLCPAYVCWSCGRGKDCVMTIYVPVGSKAAYEAIEAFSLYKIVEGEAPTIQIPIVVRRGHVTGGDKITITDALEVLKHLAGITTLTGNSFEAALITPQSQSARRISIGDVLEILKHLAGISKIG